MMAKAFARKVYGVRFFGPLPVVVLLSSLLGACAGGPPPLPEPRPVVIRSGERLYADPERMAGVDTWFKAQRDNIVNDPTFMISAVPLDSVKYPWESLYLATDPQATDSATFSFPYGFEDARVVYEVYAHYRLMKESGRIAEFLPEGDTMQGFSFERAILARVADAWFLGRAVYEAAPYEPLEEILYANEAGYLDAMILTARGDEFEEEREAWVRENPDGLEQYREWFMATFSREPPGLEEKG